MLNFHVLQSASDMPSILLNLCISTARRGEATLEHLRTPFGARRVYFQQSGFQFATNRKLSAHSIR